MNRKTIGLLHCGEMGCAVAAALREVGHRVLTITAGRSPATLARCEQIGVDTVESMSALLQQADLVFSLVPPAAAAEIVDDVCRHRAVAKPQLIYVDLNSISPAQSCDLASRIEKAGLSYVDGAINGLAKNLRNGGTVFLSGQQASEVAALFPSSVRVNALGDAIGSASLMKMLLAGLSKGVCGLFAELAIVAHRNDSLDSFITTAADIYPGLMTLVERMLPTYAKHAVRRADEMGELLATAADASMQPAVLSGLKELHDALAGVHFESASGVDCLIRQLSQKLFTTEPQTITTNPL